MSTTPFNKSTDGGYSVEIKTFYKKGLIYFSEKRTVFNQFGQAATIPRNQGKTYEWRRPSQFTKVTGATTVLAEGVIPAGSTLTYTTITASPAQYGDYFAGTDVIDATIYDPIRTYVVDAQAYQMAQVIDNLIQTGVLAGSTNHQFSSVTGTRTARNQITTGDVITETEIRKVIRTLKRNSARPLRDGKYVAVIHPDTWYSLTADPDIRELIIYADGSGKGSMFTGELGQSGASPSWSRSWPRRTRPAARAVFPSSSPSSSGWTTSGRWISPASTPTPSSTTSAPPGRPTR
jgi:N4-gp56 family major capsid protein